MKKGSFYIILMLLTAVILCCAYPNTVLCEEAVAAADPKIVCDSVLILEPFIVYENAYNEQNMHAVDTNVKNMFNTDTSIYAMNVLSKTGLKPLSGNALTAEQRMTIAGAYDNLQNNSEELVKQWKDKSRFLKDFTLIQDGCKVDAILAQYVKVKVGSPGGWDFMFTGAVIPDSSTTSIKIVLLDLKTGKTYWSNSSIERTVPNNSNVIKRLLDSVYSNFPGYNKKEGKG